MANKDFVAAGTDMPLSKLTLAIPIYNDHAFIGATIESCLNQAGEIWLYDNASTDGTSDICAAYAQKFPHIKHIRHNENCGMFENFRKPLFECQTEYFQWLGSHDILGCNFSLNLTEALEKDPALVLAFGHLAYIDEEGNSLKIKNKSRYIKKMQDDDPFERMKNHLANHRECLIVYGVWRTAALRRAWPRYVCYAPDDVLLLRAAAAGKFIYMKGSVFYARNFPTLRKGENYMKRQCESLALKPVPQNSRGMTLQMIESIADQLQHEENIGKAFQVFDAMYKRYYRRWPRTLAERKARRNRRALAILPWLILLGLLVTWACSRL